MYAPRKTNSNWKKGLIIALLWFTPIAVKATEEFMVDFTNQSKIAKQYYDNGQYQKALIHWLTALKLGPAEPIDNRGKELYYICDCYYHQHEYILAYFSCKKAYDICIQQGEYALGMKTVDRLVDLWLLSGNVDEAATRARKQLVFIDSSAVNDTVKAHVYALAGKTAAAMGYSNSAISYFNQGSSVYLNANLFEAYGEVQLAKAKALMQVNRFYAAADVLQTTRQVLGDKQTPEWVYRSYVMHTNIRLTLNQSVQLQPFIDTVTMYSENAAKLTLQDEQDYFEVALQIAKQANNIIQVNALQESYQRFLISSDYNTKLNELTLSINNSRDTASSQKKVENTAVQTTNNVTIPLVVLTIFCLGLIFSNVNIRQRYNSLLAEKRKHEEERKKIKQELFMQSKIQPDYIDQSLTLDRSNIEAHISKELNTSDWLILETLYKYPTKSNNELAEEVNISYDGLRSSLKKMYRLFNIDGKVTNKKLALLVEALRYSMKD